MGVVKDQIELADMLHELVEQHRAWSLETFGERGPVGPLRHLAKEAAEAADAAGGPSEPYMLELADCFLLLLDAVWRSDSSLLALVMWSHQKLVANRGRTWQRGTDPDQPVEHIRESGEMEIIYSDSLPEIRRQAQEAAQRTDDAKDWACPKCDRSSISWDYGVAYCNHCGRTNLGGGAE